jgi:hypothetical protein
MHQATDRAIERCDAEEPQIDNKDRADYHNDREHVDGFNPGEQDFVLSDRLGDDRRLQPLQSAIQLHRKLSLISGPVGVDFIWL